MKQFGDAHGWKTETPDQPGWYWQAHRQHTWHEWTRDLVYIDDELAVHYVGTSFDEPVRRLDGEHWRWIGPIEKPGIPGIARRPDTSRVIFAHENTADRLELVAGDALTAARSQPLWGYIGEARDRAQDALDTARRAETLAGVDQGWTQLAGIALSVLAQFGRQRTAEPEVQR